jgi:hypothetical protein
VNVEDYCSDCCIYFWCCPLATCQDWREVKVIKEKRGNQTVVVRVKPGQGMVIVPMESSGGSQLRKQALVHL